MTMTFSDDDDDDDYDVLSPLIRGGSKAGIFNEERKTKDERLFRSDAVANRIS